MTPRPNKPTGTLTTPPPQEGTPKIESGVQDHSFHAQAIYDINKQVGKLEVCLDHIDKRLEKVEIKLDTVLGDVSSLKTQIGTLTPVIKSALSLIKWFIGIVATFGLAVLGMWLRHHFGW